MYYEFHARELAGFQFEITWDSGFSGFYCIYLVFGSWYIKSTRIWSHSQGTKPRYVRSWPDHQMFPSHQWWNTPINWFHSMLLQKEKLAGQLYACCRGFRACGSESQHLQWIINSYITKSPVCMVNQPHITILCYLLTLIKYRTFPLTSEAHKAIIGVHAMYVNEISQNRYMLQRDIKWIWIV